MSNRIIIAVGGSGQTVVSHYLRYATLAGVAGEELPDIYIMDADLKESVRENEAKSSLYGEIKKLHDRLVAGLSPTNKPSLNLLYPYRSDTLLNAQQTFAEYLIGHRQQGTAEKARKKILDGLFGEQEQKLNIAEGFFARPNVGATAIFDRLICGETENDQELLALRRVVTDQADARIVVIGSSFGGTGSGGAPVIAQQLRRWASGRSNSVRIGVFMTLPWFSPGDLGKTFPQNTDTLGKLETQYKNTAAGLRFYGSSEVFLNHLDLYLADFNGEKHGRWDDSNTGQPEYPHSFNLIIAAQIQNYLMREIDTKEETGQYGLYFLAPASERRKMELDGHNSALFRFTTTPQLRQDLANWAQQSQTLRLVLCNVAEYIQRDFKLSDAGQRNRPLAFITLVMALAEKSWLLDAVIEKKGLFSSTRDASPSIYALLASYLHGRAEQLGGSIEWLRRAWEESRKIPNLHSACLSQNPELVWDNYPALNRDKKDRNAEVAAIRLFDAAFDQSANIVAEFINRVERGSEEPFHAAAAIVEKQLRQAILIRGGMGVQGSKDEQPPTVAQDKTAVALLPLQVNANMLRNHYSLAINLTEVLNRCKGRDGKDVSVLDEIHPATLSGVKHFNVPSLWAAAHLTAWQQSINVDSTAPAPLWQQAKNDLAALLWGVFTKRLHLHSVAYDKLGRLGTLLSKSLEAELFGYQNNQLKQLAYLTDATGEQTIALNHPACAWFPAPDLGDKWWNKLGYDLPTEINSEQADSLEIRQLLAFKEYLGQLIDLSHTQDTGKLAGWYSMVSSLSAELGARIPKGAQAAKTIESEQKFYILDQQSKNITQAFIAILSDSDADLIDQYCVAEVAVVALTNEFRAADSPLRSEMLGIAGVDAELKEVLNNAEGKPVAVRYRLTLPERGWFDMERPARLIDSFYTHSEIWPNFTLPGWQFYFLGSVSADERSLKNFGFSIFNKEGKRIGNQGRNFSRNHEIHGVPEYLVFELLQEKREAGIFNVGLITSSSGSASKHFNLAIDFGTSHSCAYATTTDGKRIPLDLSAPMTQLGSAVFNFPFGKEEYLVKAVHFLPGYNSLPQDSDSGVLPTEFRMIGNPFRQEIDNGIESFVMIPMRFITKFSETDIRGVETLGSFKWQGGLDGTVFEGEELGLSKTYLQQMLRIALAILRNNGYSRMNQFRATFPEAFDSAKRHRYAEVIDKIMENIFAETGITYQGGGAFPDADQLLKLASLHADEHNIGAIKRTSSGLVSESVAALLSASTSDNNFLADRSICIVLDMGGGTTDVAAYFSPGGGKREPVPAESITDSIRYAGHDLLQLLAHPKVISDILKTPQTNLAEDACLQMLKILVRDENHFDRLRGNFSNKNYLPDLKERIILFFEGLFEYTRLLTQAYQKTLQNDQNWIVNVALFGNGWRLAELVYPRQGKAFDGFTKNFEKYLHAALGEERKINIHYQALPDASIKEAIAAGALKFNPLDRQINNPMEYTSLAGLHVTCFDNNRQEKLVAPDDFLLGFDREKFDAMAPLSITSLKNLRAQPFHKKLQERFKRDDEWIANQISAAINQAIREQWLVPGDREPMKFSPMKLFLETVWKETLRAMPLNIK